MASFSRQFIVIYCGYKIKIRSRDKEQLRLLRNDWLEYISEDNSTGVVHCQITVQSTPRRKLQNIKTPLRGKSYRFNMLWRRRIFKFSNQIYGYENISSVRRLWITGSDVNKVREITFLYVQSVIGEYMDILGFHRIHGLGITDSQSALVVPLDSNHGKSSFSYWTLKNTTLRLMSDEVVFTDGKYAFGFATRMALRSAEGVASEDIFDLYTRKGHNPKYLVKWPGDKLCNEARFFKIWLPRNKHSHVLFALKFIFGIGVTQMLEFMLRPDNFFRLIQIFFSRVIKSIKVLSLIQSRAHWSKWAEQNYAHLMQLLSAKVIQDSRSVTIDVLVITRRRRDAFKKCVDSLIQAQKSVVDLPIKLNFIVGLNGEDQETQELMEQYRQIYPQNFTWKSIVQALPGEARNQLLPHSRAEWVFFADDDIYVESDFFRHWHSLICNHPDVDVFGGPNLTPEDSTLFQKLQGQVLGSFSGTGIFFGRYRKLKDGPTGNTTRLTLCNLFFRRSLNCLTFPAGFICGEETDLLHRLKRAGCKFYYSSRLSVYHDRRPTYSTFCNQIIKYGVGRAEAGSNLTFVLSLCGIGALVYFICRSPQIAFALVFFYLVLVLTGCFYITLTEKWARKHFLFLFLLHISLHVCYMWGILSKHYSRLKLNLSVRGISPKQEF